MNRWRICPLVVFAVIVGCGPMEGRLDILTYNVAGLPEGFSGSQPERFMPMFSAG